MIRVDYKKGDKGFVQTTWVREVENGSSLMGRLLFDACDFDKLMKTTLSTGLFGSEVGEFIYFEEKG